MPWLGVKHKSVALDNNAKWSMYKLNYKICIWEPAIFSMIQEITFH